ncbi:MAG: hypothetical protein FJW40_14555 [Acidobacteria bacterium]|nr:hypothetical protein [Acidobacteriota bacterium]
MATFVATAGAVRERAEAVPWYVWCLVAAVTSAMVGGHWDISWHRSIGRDTFWTPAHIAIYLCGVLAGAACGYMILATTAGRGPIANEGAWVRMWGFRGPLGAFIAAWGGVAMLASAPFDDWWHAAYGLDVKVLSPPHVVLILGIMAIESGALILILGYMNRASGALQRKLDGLFLYTGGMILVLLMIGIIQETGHVGMHSAQFYRTVAVVTPLVLTGVARASGRRWAATTVALVYMVFLIGLILVLPLFPAEPKLGPVLTKVTHFIPPNFPLLLVVPALFLDILLRRAGGANRWLLAVAGGVGFVGVFAAVQWPFANFLMSPASENAFFGTGYHDYLTGPKAYTILRKFWLPETTPGAFWTVMGQAVAVSILMTRLGLAWGDWMRRIRR